VAHLLIQRRALVVGAFLAVLLVLTALPAS